MAKKKNENGAESFILMAVFLVVMFISSIAPLIYLGIIILLQNKTKRCSKKLIW